MRTQFGRLVSLAVAALAAAALAAGCGGGGGTSKPGTGGPISDTAVGSASGISATAKITGVTLALTASTERSDIASSWAIIKNSAGQEVQVSLGGSGKNWSGSIDVSADPGSILAISVYARDSLGNQIGPARLQVRMSEFGAQSAVVGTVVSGEDGSPIAGATVTLGNQATATDANGRFVITDLVVGNTLTGTVSKSGFSEKSFTVTVKNETVDVGTIALPATQDLPPPAPVFP